MATSPLAAALLGGDSGANGFADPNLAAVQNDMQTGQALTQQGLSTAPASPWQALARLGQAAAGGYLQQGARSDLSRLYAHQAEALKPIFKPGTPVGDMLASNDPATQMLGIKLAEKVGVLRSEPYSLSPAEARYEGPNQVATNTNPRSPTMIQQQDIENARARAAAAAQPGARPPFPTAPAIPAPAVTLTKSPGVPLNPPRMGGIGDVVGMGPGGPGTPSGTPLSAAAGVPLTAPNFADRFAAAGPVPPPGPPSATVAPTSVPRSPFQDSIDLDAKKVAAEEAARNPVLAQRAGMVKQAEYSAEYGNYAKEKPAPAKGPGGTEPIEVWHNDPMTGTSQKTVIPALKDQGPIDRSPASLKENIPAWQKTVAGWNTGLKAAQEADQRLATVETALKTVQSGWGTTQKAAVNAAAKSLGLPEILPNAKPADVEKIFHEASIETLKRLQATMQGTGSRIAVAEFNTLTKQGLNPDLQPEANLQMIAEDRGALRQSMDLPRDWAMAKSQYGWENPQAFERAWYDKNGLSGYVNTTKKEIGPLKGMEGNRAGPAGAKPAAANGTWTDPKTNKTYQVIDGALHQ